MGDTLANGIVRLNVGGRVFMTTRSTLLANGESFFSGLLSPSFSSVLDEEGRIFIDRDGELFFWILECMRAQDGVEGLVTKMRDHFVRNVRNGALSEDELERQFMRHLSRVAREAEYYSMSRTAEQLQQVVDETEAEWEEEEALREKLRWDGFYVHVYGELECERICSRKKRGKELEEGASNPSMSAAANCHTVSHTIFPSQPSLSTSTSSASVFSSNSPSSFSTSSAFSSSTSSQKNKAEQSVLETTTQKREVADVIAFRRNGSMLMCSGVDAAWSMKAAAELYELLPLWDRCESITDTYASFFIRNFARGRYWYDGQALKVMISNDLVLGGICLEGRLLLLPAATSHWNIFEFVPWSTKKHVILWRERELTVSAADAAVVPNVRKEDGETIELSTMPDGAGAEGGERAGGDGREAEALRRNP